MVKEGMRVELENGFYSLAAVYTPEHPYQALFICHSGHEGLTGRDQAAIRALLRAGYPVWWLDMPLIGTNPREVAVTLPEAGRVFICQHHQMAYFDELTTGLPLRYFIEPVVAFANQAQAYRDFFYRRTLGLRLDGTSAATVDVRIRGSYPIAAGVPLGRRFDRDRKN